MKNLLLRNVFNVKQNLSLISEGHGSQQMLVEKPYVLKE